MLQLSCLQTVYNCFVPLDCSQYPLSESTDVNCMCWSHGW